MVFTGVVLARFGPDRAGELVAGWVTEYSLSVDDLFVFLVLMGRFAVPPSVQLRVLTVGIVLALVLRGLLIAVGAVVIARYSWAFVIFGVFLLRTAWGLLRGGQVGGSDGGSDGGPNALVRLLEQLVPTSREWHGRRPGPRPGRRPCTPSSPPELLLAAREIPDVYARVRSPDSLSSCIAWTGVTTGVTSIRSR